MAVKLKFPQATLYTVRTKGGKVQAALRWKKGMKPKWEGQYDRAQYVLDSEILRGCNARYVPKDTGMLTKLGVLGTKPGSGEVVWFGPYVRFQYYLVNRKTSRNVNIDGGAYWFNRFWAAQGKRLLKRVRKITGGTGK